MGPEAAGTGDWGELYQPAGEGKVGWVDVRDVGAVNAEILLNPGEHKNSRLVLTGNEVLPYSEAVAVMNRVLGKDARYVAIPDETAVEAMQKLELPEFVIEVMMSLNRAIKEGHAEETTDAVERILRRKPIRFEQFVNDNANAWK